MTDYPIIIENSMSCGIVDGKRVSSSILNAASSALICRGANRIIIPTPGENEYKRTIDIINDIPKERKPYFQIIDKNGQLLKRVRNYLSPLTEQAVKWPETAYISFLEGFLYHLSIATKYKAGIAHNDIRTLRGFIPIIDPESFKDEARYRLAETINLVCCYEPYNPLHGLLKTEISHSNISDRLWNIIDTTEFNSIVSESGKLGYVKNPRIGLRKIKNLFISLFKRPEVTPLLGLAHTSAELSGNGIPINAIEQIIKNKIHKNENGRNYSPPFIDIGPAILSIYSIALFEKYPKATPPEGTIMLLETLRDGKAEHSWLNVGEEKKLEIEALNSYDSSIESYRKCIETQRRFYK